MKISIKRESNACSGLVPFRRLYKKLKLTKELHRRRLNEIL